MTAARPEPGSHGAGPGASGRTLDLYVAAVGLVGAVVVTRAALQVPAVAHPAHAAVFAVLALLAGRFALRIPGLNARFSVADTFFITSGVLFGAPLATVTIAIDSVLMCYGRGYALRRVVFNLAAPALAFRAGCAVFFATLGSAPLFEEHVSPNHFIVPLIGLTAVYYVLNSALTAVAVGLEKGISPLVVWRGLTVVGLNYAGAASAAFFVAVAVQSVGLAALSGVVPLFAMFHFAMRSWTGRLEDAERHVQKVDRLYLSTIEAFSTAIEAKDGVTSSHVHRVRHYAVALARRLGTLDDIELKAIQAAALLHDTGKLAVPERILNKPGKLTAAEFETMKLHVDVGADILSAIDFPFPVVPIVRAHHERWDGTGYPNGLKGTDIPLGARILSVVDCYDALTSDRPYRPAMTDDQALAIIREGRGTMYDPAIVDLFAETCREIGPIATGSSPHLQKAVQLITRAVAPVPPSPPVQPAPAEAVVPASGAPDAPDALLTLINLARIVGGRPTAADVAAMVWQQVRHLVPRASGAFFMVDGSAATLSARFVGGDASGILQGVEFGVGDRLTGWVADHRQPIVNSDAHLDLGPEAAIAGLRFCTALPLDRMGVLSLYGPEPFGEDEVRMLQMLAPHLAQMFIALEDRLEPAPPRTRSRSQLRVVASR
ncbi:MAG: HD domain-containing phosphohydrolase [Microbacteriaceae bacterium]